MKALSNNFAGIETNIKNYIFNEEFQAAQYGEQLYSGPGCIVKFICKIPNVENTTNCLVTRVLMKINNSNKKEPIYEDILTNIDVHNEIDFQYLFSEWGDYTINLIFHTNTGKDYTKQVKFTIDENVFNLMTVKKVQKKSADILFNLSNFDLKNELFSYSMTNKNVPEGAEYYSQYLYTGTDINTIGMNSIIAIELNGDYNDSSLYGKLKLIKNNTSETLSLSLTTENNLYNDLNSNFPYYIWFIRWAHQTIEEDSPIVPYLIGIRKNFTISQDSLIDPESNDTGLFNDGNIISYKKNLYKKFAYSINKRNHVFEKNINYNLEIKYRYELNLQTSNIQTIAYYILYKIADNTKTVIINEEYINLSNSLKFNKSFNIYDDDLKMNLILDFEDDVPQYNYYNIYGIDSYKIFSLEYYEDNINNILLRREFINEDKFIPIFHNVVDLDDNTAQITDTLVIIPTLKWLKQLDIQDANHMWVFHNASTNENFYSDTLEQIPINVSKPLLGKYKPLQITPGYYDIILNAKIWDNMTTTPMKVESMFLLK